MKDLETIQNKEMQYKEMQFYEPEMVLGMGQKMANALKRILSQNNWTVKIGPSEHLKFEAWQTLGSFFGYVPTILKVEELNEGDKVIGYLCYAGVKRLKNGEIISEAEAACLRDEPNWKDKPLFQLRSMAQTRACSKALRLCFSWIVALAGYDPTPAEEMGNTAFISSETSHSSGLQETSTGATPAQLKMIHSLMNKLGIKDRDERISFVNFIIQRNIKASKELTKQEATKIINYLKENLESANES